MATLMSDASFCLAPEPRRPSCKASRSSVAVSTHGTDLLKPSVAGTANWTSSLKLEVMSVPVKDCMMYGSGRQMMLLLRSISVLFVLYSETLRLRTSAS